jgi:putative colanic acid biosynthesis acetyltransferase WcaF
MSTKKALHTYDQASAYASPWTLQRRVLLLLWELAWALLCRWTPKPCNGWRLFVLRCFGAEIQGRPFVHQRARIQIPWNLTMHDKSCLGDRANAYSLARIKISERATVAQEAYLCTGTHDFSLPHIPLQTGEIMVGADAFIGARAFILPGVTVGCRSVVGACSVVSRDVESDIIVAGNPATLVRRLTELNQFENPPSKPHCS